MARGNFMLMVKHEQVLGFARVVWRGKYGGKIRGRKNVEDNIYEVMVVVCVE